MPSRTWADGMLRQTTIGRFKQRSGLDSNKAPPATPFILSQLHADPLGEILVPPRSERINRVFGDSTSGVETIYPRKLVFASILRSFEWSAMFYTTLHYGESRSDN